MFRLVTRWISKAAASSWKGGKTVLKYISKSKGYKFVRPILRVADLGFTGYFVYDIFFRGDGDENLQEGSIASLLFPKNIILGLHTPMQDMAAYVLGLRNSGLLLMQSGQEDIAVQGLAYLNAATYFEATSSPDQRYFSNPELLEKLESVASWDVPEDNKADFEATMKEFRKGVDSGDVDDAYLKQVDYTIYQLSHMAKAMTTEEEKSSTNSNDE